MSLVTRRLLKRALAEKQQEFRKRAFIPMGSAAEKTGAQAPGPGGMPIDPAAGGGAPMDPAMGGMPPMDPAMMGGMPPMDPAMGGMPPMDPAAMGAPMDMPLPPEGELPPPPPEEGGGEGEGLTAEDAETVDKITQRTLDVVKQTLEMVGKAKTPKPEEGGEAAAPAAEAPPEPPPEAMPGPVTGEPGFNPADFGGGTMKAASAIVGRALIKCAQVPGEEELSQEFVSRHGPRPAPSTDHVMSQPYRDRQAQIQSWEAKKKAFLKERAEWYRRHRAPAPAAAGAGSSGPIDPGWRASALARRDAVRKSKGMPPVPPTPPTPAPGQ
jgi:hypothetical protein